MGWKVTQSKFSGNTFWKSRHASSGSGAPSPGSTSQLAINLTVDAQLLNHTLKGGTVWIKFSPTYTYPMNFFIFRDGQFSLPTDLSNYTSFDSDLMTENDISEGYVENVPAGNGPDVEGREGWYVFLNYQYQVGEEYYVSFTVPVTGTYGLSLYAD